MRCWYKSTQAFTYVLCGVLLGSCKSPRSLSGSPIAPDFELKDTHGKSVRLSDYRGHPILLDFWATWCGPCVMSIPSTEKLYEANKSKGLIVLGLNMDDDPTEIPAFIKHMGMTYPILYAGNSSVPARYGLEGLPLFMVIDPQGHVTHRYDGYSPVVADALDEELTQMVSAANH